MFVVMANCMLHHCPSLITMIELVKYLVLTITAIGGGQCHNTQFAITTNIDLDTLPVTQLYPAPSEISALYELIDAFCISLLLFLGL